MTTKAALLSLPHEDLLPHVLSYLALSDIIRMRLVCAQFRNAVYESTHHLWMDDNYDAEAPDDEREHPHLTSARRIRLLLQNFPNLRSLRVIGLRLMYQSLVQGRNGGAMNPRYLCSLLQEAECAQRLECLELLEVSETSAENSLGEWGAASTPSYSLHTDLMLQGLRNLTLSMAYATNSDRENPLVHTLLRSSLQIVHLNLSNCACIDDYHLQEAILKPLVNLTHLNLSSSRVRRPTIRSATLRSLVLQGCMNLFSLHPESSCPLLEVLDLNSCPAFNGKGLLDNPESGLSKFCPRLRMLNLRNCLSLRGVAISSTTSPYVSLELLQSIDLSWCVHLNVVKIAMRSLKSINVGQCLRLRDLSISSPVMETLDLAYLSLEHITVRCPSLVHLNLACSRNLGDKRRVNKSAVESEALRLVDIRQARYLTPEFIFDATRNCNNKFSIVCRDDDIGRHGQEGTIVLASTDCTAQCLLY